MDNARTVIKKKITETENVFLLNISHSFTHVQFNFTVLVGKMRPSPFAEIPRDTVMPGVISDI